MRLLAFCTLLLVVIGMAAIGLLRFRVFFGDQPSVDELLDLAIQAETLNLVQAQNHSEDVKTVMNDLHALCMFKLESFSSSNFAYFQYTSSLFMSFAIITTTGDDRVDDSNMIVYLIYSSTASIIIFLIVALLMHQFEQHLDALFACNNTNINDNQQSTNKISEEYFLMHLQRKRTSDHACNRNRISFGGNKLELYEEESRTVRRVLQPAIAVLLIFLAYVLVGAVLLYLIVDPTNSLVTDIFANYFYVSTISSPQWIYLNNPDIWQLLFLVGNAFFGNILVCAANVNIASVTLYYLNAIISARSTKRQLQKENCSSLIHS